MPLFIHDEKVCCKTIYDTLRVFIIYDDDYYCYNYYSILHPLRTHTREMLLYYDHPSSVFICCCSPASTTTTFVSSVLNVSLSSPGGKEMRKTGAENTSNDGKTLSHSHSAPTRKEKNDQIKGRKERGKATALFFFIRDLVLPTPFHRNAK